MAHRVYLSLGSNLGDRARNLRRGLELFPGRGIQTVRVSSIYETEPQDVADQPWFLNVVVEAETDLTPHELLSRTQAIEAELGRERTVSRGPRTLDIDILLYDDLLVSAADLRIPHPRMNERRFVLEPLAELEPDLVKPDVLAKTRGQKVRRISSPFPPASC